MIRHIHMHRIPIQAGGEGFLEAAPFELGLAGGAGGLSRVRVRHSWLMVPNKQRRDPGCMKVRDEAGGNKTKSEPPSGDMGSHGGRLSRAWWRQIGILEHQWDCSGEEGQEGAGWRRDWPPG